MLPLLQFPHGLIGFEAHQEFQLIDSLELAPVLLLQSVQDEALSFVAAPVTAIDASYELELGDEERALLGTSDLLCLTILAPENGHWSANLMAPVVVNRETHVAVQAVRSDNRYSHRYPIALEATACS